MASESYTDRLSVYTYSGTPLGDRVRASDATNSLRSISASSRAAPRSAHGAGIELPPPPPGSRAAVEAAKHGSSGDWQQDYHRSQQHQQPRAVSGAFLDTSQGSGRSPNASRGPTISPSRTRFDHGGAFSSGDNDSRYNALGRGAHGSGNLSPPPPQAAAAAAAPAGADRSVTPTSLVAPAGSLSFSSWHSHGTNAPGTGECDNRDRLLREAHQQVRDLLTHKERATATATELLVVQEKLRGKESECARLHKMLQQQREESEATIRGLTEKMHAADVLADSRVRRHEDQAHEAQEALRYAQKEIEQKSERLRAFERDQSGADRALAEERERHEQTRAELARVRAEAQRAEAKADEATRGAVKADVSKVSLLEQLQVAEREANCLRNDLEEQRRRKDELVAELLQLQREHEGAQERSKDLSRQLQQLPRMREELAALQTARDEVASLRRALEQSDAATAAAYSQRRTLELEREQQILTIRSLEGDTRRLESELHHAQCEGAERQTIQRELEEARDSLDVSHATVVDLQRQLAQSRDDLMRHVAQHEAFHNAVTSEFALLRSALEAAVYHQLPSTTTASSDSRTLHGTGGQRASPSPVRRRKGEKRKEKEEEEEMAEQGQGRKRHSHHYHHHYGGQVQSADTESDSERSSSAGSSAGSSATAPPPPPLRGARPQSAGREKGKYGSGSILATLTRHVVPNAACEALFVPTRAAVLEVATAIAEERGRKNNAARLLEAEQHHNSGLEEALRTANNSLNSMQLRLAEANRTASEQAAQISALQRRISDTEAADAERAAAFARVFGDDAVAASWEVAHRRAVQVATEAKELQRVNADLHSELSSATAALGAEKKARAADRSGAEARRSREVSELELAHSQRMSEAARLQESLKEAVATASKRADGALRELAAVQENYDKTLAALRQRQDRCDALDESVRRLESVVSTKEALVQGKNDEIETLTDAVDEAQCDVRRARERLEQLERKVVSGDEQLRTTHDFLLLAVRAVIGLRHTLKNVIAERNAVLQLSHALDQALRLIAQDAPAEVRPPKSLRVAAIAVLAHNRFARMLSGMRAAKAAAAAGFHSGERSSSAGSRQVRHAARGLVNDFNLAVIAAIKPGELPLHRLDDDHETLLHLLSQVEGFEVDEDTVREAEQRALTRKPSRAAFASNALVASRGGANQSRSPGRGGQESLLLRVASGVQRRGLAAAVTPAGPIALARTVSRVYSMKLREGEEAASEAERQAQALRSENSSLVAVVEGKEQQNQRFSKQIAELISHTSSMVDKGVHEGAAQELVRVRSKLEEEKQVRTHAEERIAAMQAREMKLLAQQNQLQNEARALAVELAVTRSSSNSNSHGGGRSAHSSRHGSPTFVGVDSSATPSLSIREHRGRGAAPPPPHHPNDSRAISRSGAAITTTDVELDSTGSADDGQSRVSASFGPMLKSARDLRLHGHRSPTSGSDDSRSFPEALAQGAARAPPAAAAVAWRSAAAAPTTTPVRATRPSASPPRGPLTSNDDTSPPRGAGSYRHHHHHHHTSSGVIGMSSSTIAMPDSMMGTSPSGRNLLSMIRHIDERISGALGANVSLSQSH